MAGIDLQLNLGGEYAYVQEDVVSPKHTVAHGDFAIINGKFQLVPDDDLARQVGQRLHVRLNLYRGEVFFNTAAGFPYLDMSKFKRGSAIFDTNMKSYIIATDGVNNLQRYSSALDRANRVENVSFDVGIGSGQTVNINQEFNV